MTLAPAATEGFGHGLPTAPDDVNFYPTAVASAASLYVNVALATRDATTIAFKNWGGATVTVEAHVRVSHSLID